jgi:hypothetical protein
MEDFNSACRAAATCSTFARRHERANRMSQAHSAGSQRGFKYMAESRRNIRFITGQTVPGTVKGSTWLGQMNPQFPWELPPPIRPVSTIRTCHPIFDR